MGYIKKLEEKDWDRFIDISINAYPVIKAFTKEDKDKRKEHLKNIQREDDNVNYYGLFREDELIAGMRYHDFIINLFNLEIKASGIGAVAVDLIHKKEKAAKEIVTDFIQYSRGTDANIAILYPFRPDFYKKMGFGFGTKMNQYRIKPCNLPKGNSKEHICFLTDEDKELVHYCHKRYFEKTHGLLYKPNISKEILGINPVKAVGYKKDDMILGYILFKFKQLSHNNILKNDIEILELVYENSDVLSEMLTFLNTQNDQINRIVVNTQDENFHFLLNDPRNGSDNIIPHVYHESNIQAVGIMYKIVNVSGIFNDLKQHNFGRQTYRLKLSIRDSFSPKNEGSYIINFNKGFAEIKENSEYDVEVKIDISDFSSLFIGAVDFKSLYRYGLVSISDESYVGIINETFRVDEKPVCMTAF